MIASISHIGVMRKNHYKRLSLKMNFSVLDLMQRKSDRRNFSRCSNIRLKNEIAYRSPNISAQNWKKCSTGKLDPKGWNRDLED